MSFAISHSVRSFCLRDHRSRRVISHQTLLLVVLVLMVALLSVSVIGSWSASAATVSFADKHDFSTGTNPRSIAVGDLNGDGKLDLAVANVNYSDSLLFHGGDTAAT